MDCTRLRLREDRNDFVKSLPPGGGIALVIHSRGQASPFLDVLPKEK